MKNVMNELKVFSRRLSIVLMLCLLISSLSGCEPLKKKFTRQNKKDKQAHDFIPVLTPIDYGQKTESPEEKYKYHFSLWRVWQGDLIQVIEKNESDKRQIYLLDQVIIQLVEMQKWLNENQARQLAIKIDEVKALRRIYQKPVQLRNVSILKTSLDHIFKEIRREYSPGPAISYKFAEKQI